MTPIEIKNGLALSAEEKLQIKESLFREFKAGFPSTERLSKTLFFLLKEKKTILSLGGLLKTEPVFFDGNKYSLFGVVNVISNIKSKGFGKQVVSQMRQYLKSNDLTGIGYCYPRFRGFYEKCGFLFAENAARRFIYPKDKARISNQDGQIIFYADSSDEFMKNVLLQPEKEIYLPSVDLW